MVSGVCVLYEIDHMKTIGQQKIKSYIDDELESRAASNKEIRASSGHPVSSYFELAKKVAELQFLNQEHILLFRGQRLDYKTIKKSSMLKATLFRLSGSKIPTTRILEQRFKVLSKAEEQLIRLYSSSGFLGLKRLRRHRIIRWSILQHYEVCATPLLDVTRSLRIAASFASSCNQTDRAFVFVFGVPNLSGGVTAIAEAGLQVIRLSSACPPAAVRPHMQEGYLLGEYPEISDVQKNARYSYYEMDFGRRLIAKFCFDPVTFWGSDNYTRVPDAALYPAERRDPLLTITSKIRTEISDTNCRAKQC